MVDFNTDHTLVSFFSFFVLGDEMSRKIDALIAEHVMGYEAYQMKGAPEDMDVWRENKGKDAVGLVDIPLPRYSTNIAAAWEVLDKICTDSKASFSLDRMWGKNRYGCGFYKGDNFEHALCFAAGTAPMAICLAALKTKGILL